MKTFKQYIKESDSDHYYMIHGGSDFDEIDSKKFGSGEPGNIRPLGHGIYGFIVDPNNEKEAHGAIDYAKIYSKKYGGSNKKLHLYKIPKTTVNSYNGYEKHLDLPGPSDTSPFQMRSSRLPINQTEVSVHDHKILKKVGKFDIDTPNEHILGHIK